MINRFPLINLNDFSKFSTLPHERIILAPSPILSNEVSMGSVNSHQQFHKMKVDPSTKYSFYPVKDHLKLIRLGKELWLMRFQYKNTTSFFQHHVLHKGDLPAHLNRFYLIQVYVHQDCQEAMHLQCGNSEARVSTSQTIARIYVFGD